MSKKEDQKSISQILEEVSNIAERFEHDDRSLEQMIEDYEKGVQLIREAQFQLANAEMKINQVTTEENADKGESELRSRQAEQ